MPSDVAPALWKPQVSELRRSIRALESSARLLDPDVEQREALWGAVTGHLRRLLARSGGDAAYREDPPLATFRREA